MTETEMRTARLLFAYDFLSVRIEAWTWFGGPMLARLLRARDKVAGILLRDAVRHSDYPLTPEHKVLYYRNA